MPPQPDNPLRAAAQPVSGTRRRLGNQPFFFVLGVIAAIIFTIGWGIALFSYSGNTLGQVHHQTFAWRIVSDTEARISSRPTAVRVRAVDPRLRRVPRRSRNNRSDC